MAEQQKTPNGAAPADGQQQVQIQVLGQYIKDLSFENPNVDRLVETGAADNPKLELEVNVNGSQKGAGLFESAINFKATAKGKVGTIYVLEIVYAGMFRIENMPQQALEPFLLVNCPSILFPFLRRLVCDITREGGFPPLWLDPVDFAGLYLQRQRQTTPPATVAAPGKTSA